jgi:hypothetical protein
MSVADAEEPRERTSDIVSMYDTFESISKDAASQAARHSLQ